MFESQSSTSGEVKVTSQIILGDCLDILTSRDFPKCRLCYIDPPFNTGTIRKDRNGSYEDTFYSYEDFLMPRIQKILNHLTDDASLLVHLDAREVHYIKVALDRLLGRDRFMNEIIWAYDYGGRPKNRWPNKHDTILWYVLNPKNYVFNFDEMDRIPYMAPGLVSKEKAERGKTPTDVWWHTIVPTQGWERVGYPTQKPLGILERIVKVHSNPGDTILDCFCGSGTTGVAAWKHDRNTILIDSSPEAIAIAKTRLDPRMW